MTQASRKPLPPRRTVAPPPSRNVGKKTFQVKPWSSEGRGEKIIIYANTGMGKTSLAATSPSPVFIGLDEGGQKLKHPITNEDLDYIPDIESYQDVRDALQQPGILADYETGVIDTVTLLEDLAVPHMLDSVPMENGGKASNIIAYGYNKGFQHLYDLMKFILVDCDALVRQGKNVILIAQAAPNKVSNPAGTDYLCDGPRLYAGKPSIEALYCEWADHILRIDYSGLWVDKQNKKDTKGKASGDTTRIIHTKPEVYFRAKSRTLVEPVITFDSPADDSVWQFMFGDE